MKGISSFDGNLHRFVVCYGDEYDKCDTCKIKFCCYVGILPEELLKGLAGYLWVAETIEYNLFGTTDLCIVDYDYDTHDKYYNIKCYRAQLRVPLRRQ